MLNRMVYVDENGMEHDSLPRRWNNTSPVSWERLQAMGWTSREVRAGEPELPEEPAPEPEPGPREGRFDKVRLMRALEFLGLWSDFKLMVDGMGRTDWLYLCPALEGGDPDFEAVMDKLEGLLPEGVGLAGLLAGCRIAVKEVR